MKTEEEFLNMQKHYYDRDASQWSLRNKDPVVGWYEQHEKFPDYDNILFKSFDTKDKIALDYGCGPGRCLVRFANRFARVDGIDISQTNMEKAFENLKANGISNFVLWNANNGKNLEGIDSSYYDVVYSVICFQHICAFSVRDSIIKEIYRVLKDDGYFCFQMGFGGRSNNYVNYFDDQYDAEKTNGFLDVSVTDENELREHLESIGFKNYKSDIRDPCCDTHAKWIWVEVQK